MKDRVRRSNLWLEFQGEKKAKMGQRSFFFLHDWTFQNHQSTGSRSAVLKLGNQKTSAVKCSVSFYGWWLIRYVHFTNIHWAVHIHFVHFLYVHYSSISKFASSFFTLCINYKLLHTNYPKSLWLKTTNHYFLTVSVDQEFRSGLAE